MSMTYQPPTDIYEYCKNGGDGTGSEDILQCMSTQFRASQQNINYTTNVFFLIYAASLVFFMQAGFGMLSAGCVQKKNVQNTILKNFLDACGAAIAFYLVGFAFAYGDEYGGSTTGRTFIGSSNFFLMGVSEGEIYAKWLFQYAFAATAATIVAGTLAERCQMNAYLMYSVALTGFVYPVVVHFVWSKHGYLSRLGERPFLGIGMIDFAGSGVVHATGGMTALIASIILGPRRGRFYDERTGEKFENPVPFPGHSKSLQMLGTFILWFGWYGFNAGSAISLNGVMMNPAIVATAVVNTTLSGSSGAITALLTNHILVERRTGEGVYNVTFAMNGALIGCVAVTGGCAIIEPWAAIVVGITSGLLYILSSNLLLKYCIDDAVDAIPVHLFGGSWGTIVPGLFASPRGIRQYLGLSEAIHVGWFYSWGRGSSDATLLACQIIGLIFIIMWVVVIMTPFFRILNYLGWLRADSLDEIVGLDCCYHGVESNYTESNETTTERRRRKSYQMLNHQQRTTDLTLSDNVDNVQ